MEGTVGTGHRPDVLDHPMYRIAHLHGTQWVTLRKEEQHSGHHDPEAPWPGAEVYRCETCDERVLIAPGGAVPA